MTIENKDFLAERIKQAIEFLCSSTVGGCRCRLAHRSDLSIRAYGRGFAVGLLIDVLSAAAVLAIFEVLLDRVAPIRTAGSAGGP